MRIISGSYRGRRINAPANLPSRPTTDYAKESLFNILNNHFDFTEIAVLDLYSGTGNISYEFASRGAKEVSAVDFNYNCFSFIKKTVETLKFTNMQTYKSETFSFLKHNQQTFDIIFADPPYESDEHARIHQMVFEKKMLKENGWLIIEHSKKTDLSKMEHFSENRYYGKVNFSIFKISNNE